MSAPSSRGDALAARALQALAKGNVVAGLAAWRRAVEAGVSPRVMKEVLPVFAIVRGQGPRDRTPPRQQEVVPRNAGWERLWANDTEGARAYAKSQPDDVTAEGILGVADVLDGHDEDGLALLDRALANGADADLELHRIRALLRLHRLVDAGAALKRLGDGESLGRRLLHALLQALEDRGDSDRFRRAAARLASSETHLNGLFSTTLPAIVGAAAMADGLASPDALVAVLEGVLTRMAGNLGMAPTFAEASPAGERRFVRLDLPRSTRAASVEAFGALPYIGAAGVDRDLGAILAREPRSVHARCYRGELYLWLGRYDEAWELFEAAFAIEPTRWADIGKVAILTLSGRFAEAGALAEATGTRFPPIPGGTLPVYRGVLRRRVGDLVGAVADLTSALEAKPSRVACRMELCLALRGLGESRLAALQASQVLQEVAPLLVDAAEARGVDWATEPALLVDEATLEGALGAMRGNRSSSLVTWVDRGGDLRVLEPIRGSSEAAQNVLASLTR